METGLEIKFATRGVTADKVCRSLVSAHVSFEHKPAVRDLLDYLFRDIQIGT